MANQLRSVLEVKAEYLFEFTSYSHWKNKGKSWFAPYVSKYEKMVALDINKNVLTCGEDFRVAEERELYPIKVYRLIRTSEI